MKSVVETLRAASLWTFDPCRRSPGDLLAAGSGVGAVEQRLELRCFVRICSWSGRVVAGAGRRAARGLWCWASVSSSRRVRRLDDRSRIGLGSARAAGRWSDGRAAGAEARGLSEGKGGEERGQRRDREERGRLLRCLMGFLLFRSPMGPPASSLVRTRRYPGGNPPLPRFLRPAQNIDQRYWLVTSWWNCTSAALTRVPRAFGQRSAEACLSSAYLLVDVLAEQLARVVARLEEADRVVDVVGQEARARALGRRSSSSAHRALEAGPEAACRSPGRGWRPGRPSGPRCAPTSRCRAGCGPSSRGRSAEALIWLGASKCGSSRR